MCLEWKYKLTMKIVNHRQVGLMSVGEALPRQLRNIMSCAAQSFSCCNLTITITINFLTVEHDIPSSPVLACRTGRNIPVFHISLAVTGTNVNNYNQCV